MLSRMLPLPIPHRCLKKSLTVMLSTSGPGLTIRAQGKYATITVHASAGKTDPRFFRLVQACVVESVWFALVAMNNPLPSVKGQNYGVFHPVQHRKASRDDSLQWIASHFALTGKYQRAASPQATQTGTGVQDVGHLTMKPKAALEWRRFEPPYIVSMWAMSLSKHRLEGKYPNLMQALLESGEFHCLVVLIPPEPPFYFPLT
jgi:hypothetical protein